MKRATTCKKTPCIIRHMHFAYLENRNFYPILQYCQISRDGVMCKKERWKKKANAFFGIFPFFEAKPKFYGETIFLKKLQNFNFKVRYLRKGWSDIKIFCKLPTIVFYLQIQKKLEKFSKFRNKFEIAIFGPKNPPNCQNYKVLNLKKGISNSESATQH